MLLPHDFHFDRPKEKLHFAQLFRSIGQNESRAEATFILTGQIESSGPRWPTQGIKS